LGEEVTVEIVGVAGRNYVIGNVDLLNSGQSTSSLLTTNRKEICDWYLLAGSTVRETVSPNRYDVLSAIAAVAFVML
jgi:hypothetical protein